jgi:hypothetical protein
MSKFPPAVHRAIYARSQASSRTRSICSNYARYEAEKAIWASSHPDSTSEEYETAMRAIAKASGV